MQAAMVVTITLATAAAEGGGEGIAALGINTIFFLSQVISFAIVFFLLWKWGFPALTRTMDKRQAIIREGIENAKRAEVELKNANARAEEILTEARRKGQETIEQASKNAQAEANRIVEEAQARAEQIHRQSEARIQQDAQRARTELGRHVVNLSIEAASKVISKSVDDRDNRRLVEEFVTVADKSRNN